MPLWLHIIIGSVAAGSILSWLGKKGYLSGAVHVPAPYSSGGLLVAVPKSRAEEPTPGGDVSGLMPQRYQATYHADPIRYYSAYTPHQFWTGD